VDEVDIFWVQVLVHALVRKISPLRFEKIQRRCFPPYGFQSINGNIGGLLHKPVMSNGGESTLSGGEYLGQLLFPCPPRTIRQRKRARDNWYFTSSIRTDPRSRFTNQSMRIMILGNQPILGVVIVEVEVIQASGRRDHGQARRDHQAARVLFL
jgi:hypothetical protein